MQKFVTGYMDQALFDLEEVVTSAARTLARRDFDTLVGTGFSGGIVIPMLATRLEKDFVLVRKDNDDSHHSGKLIGSFGERWVFVDDFVSSGRTFRRVIDEVEGAILQLGLPSTYVGRYAYSSGFRGFTAAEDDHTYGDHSELAAKRAEAMLVQPEPEAPAFEAVDSLVATELVTGAITTQRLGTDWTSVGYVDESAAFIRKA